jgi:GT2 family glycosyltransferase
MPADVLLAYLHPDNVSASFHASLLELIQHDATHNRRLAQWVKVECASGGIPEGRNQAVEQMLSTDCEWLLFVDADMGFEGDILDRLLEVADPVERPIIGGLCFAARKVGTDDRGGSRIVAQPTLFDLVDHGDGFGPRMTGRNHFPPNTVAKVDGTGAAMLLIHRSVLTRIADKWGATWFDRVKSTDGSLMGEDIAFFTRCVALEIPTFVHTGAKTTHAKTIWLSDEDYWRTCMPPPATEECAVIVPVYRRPQNAEPFMRSLVASTGLAVCVAVCDDKADADAWDAAGADVFMVKEPSFAHKCNAGYRFADEEPWMLFVGDDVRFHPGWLDHVQWIANKYHRDFVATNDMANPRVINGDHATHPVIRRSYIDEHGASWDGPGTVAHEGYRHWHVDDEWTIKAKQLQTFVPAPGARIEHLHPMVGKAPMDDVYELGLTHKDRDTKLFEKRLAEATGVAGR